MKSKKYLVILLLFFLAVLPLSAQYYSAEEIDPLLTELENNLTELENSNKEKQNELNELQKESEQTQNELKEVEKSYQKSKTVNVLINIIIAIVSFFLGGFTFSILTM